MVTEIRIYFEGAAELKPGFRAFLDELYGVANQKGSQVRLIAGGDKGSTIEDFKLALREHRNSRNILLVDSDAPDRGRLFQSLRSEQGLPSSISREVFWMVQTMESWFLADPATLSEYYGSGFRKSSLPQNPKIEEISKPDVLRGLQAATRNTKKGAYHKTRHAPQILGRIDPAKVRDAAPNCRRLFSAILQGLAARGALRGYSQQFMLLCFYADHRRSAGPGLSPLEGNSRT